MWFAHAEATLPSGNSEAYSYGREERFGKLKFGADWVGQLTSDELTILGYFRPRWEG